MANRPKAEIELTEPLVRDLVAAQFPEFTRASVRLLARGWDNTNFRLGDHHLVRLPHRQVAVQLLLNEQRCLPAISRRVDLSVPTPTHLGQPSENYPWPWSITPWFEGSEAATARLNDPSATARTLGRFFSQLHQPADGDAPPNEYRGSPLRDREESFRTRLTQLPEPYDKAAIGAVFDEALAQPLADQDVWLHGDLHTRNMVVHDGELTAAIDWGDICAGDPATDLAAAYMLCPDNVAQVQDEAGATDAAWARARGWAVHFAVIYLLMSDDEPVMRGIGERLMAALLA